MTAVAAWIEESGNIVMGADSAGSDGFEIHSRKDAKLFYIGPFLIGGAGSYRMIQLLMFDQSDSEFLSTLTLPKNNELLYKFMVCEFIPVLRDIFEKNGFLCSGEGIADSFDGYFIVAIRGRLFIIEGDFQVGEYNDFCAIGSGCSHCLGALYACQELGIKNGRDALRLALESAEKYQNGVKGPFNFLETKFLEKNVTNTKKK